MSINTADFAALAVTIVLFAVIYYLDYKKGVDFGLLTFIRNSFWNRSWSGIWESFYIC